jgi:catechol 2,3-dioxygenase-like lactoylglutathione lyase family enzyme
MLRSQTETQIGEEPIMKRFHVHVAVADLAANIRFYSKVFGVPPTVEKPDYAKWMIDDPRVNFAISTHGAKTGVDHLGVQVETATELADQRAKVEKAEIAALDQPGAACCYSRSDKYWTTDPQGIAWETFHTLDSLPVYGTAGRPADNDAGACCRSPAAAAVQTANSGTCCP